MVPWRFTLSLVYRDIRWGCQDSAVDHVRHAARETHRRGRRYIPPLHGQSLDLILDPTQ